MKSVGIVLFITVLIAGSLALGALVIWAIWNALAGYFGFKAITYGVALLISAGLWVAGLMLAPGK